MEVDSKIITVEDIKSQLSSDPLKDTATHYLVLYSIAKFLPARVSVEIGVDDGSTTLPMLLGTAENGGKLFSVDPAPCGPALAAVANSGLSDRWMFHNCKSAEFAENCPRPIDFLFIDGDHSPEGVRYDWETFEPLVKVNGIIAFHDILNTDAFPGILELIEGDIKPHPNKWECLTLPYGWGLTLIRKLK